MNTKTSLKIVIGAILAVSILISLFYGLSVATTTQQTKQKNIVSNDTELNETMVYLPQIEIKAIIEIKNYCGFLEVELKNIGNGTVSKGLTWQISINVNVKNEGLTVEILPNETQILPETVFGVVLGQIYEISLRIDALNQTVSKIVQAPQ